MRWRKAGVWGHVLGEISKAFKAAVEEDGVEAQLEYTRRKLNLTNRVDQATKQAVQDFAVDFSAYSQARISNKLHKLGIFILPPVCVQSDYGTIW